jgi:hypothetical protein
VLPDRQDACLAARSGHRPASGIPSVFAHGQKRTRSVTAALISAAPAESANVAARLVCVLSCCPRSG